MSLDQMRLRNDFDRAYHRAKWGNRLARLRHRPNGLLSYQETRRQLVVTGESYRGIRLVPVDQIVGSTDRCHDYDSAFRPLRANSAGRWVSVARGYAAGRSLPPVQLYQVAGLYFVRDGHHRISVARVRGQGWVDAEVVEITTAGPRVGPVEIAPSPTAVIGATAPVPRQRLMRIFTTLLFDRAGVLRTP
jgi:hypothetical protein